MDAKLGFAEKVKDYINENKHNRNFLEELKSYLLKHGISKGETQKIIMGLLKIEELDKRVFILLSLAINNYLQNSDDLAWRFNSLSPYEIFEKEEIDSALRFNNLEDIHTENSNLPIIIKKARKSGIDSFVANIPISQVVQLYNSNILEYNYKINKQYKFIKNIEGNFVKTIDINLREVRKIAEGILNNELKISKVVLNVLKGSNEFGKEIEYDSKNHALRIYNSKIDIINGLHEINALAYVMEEYPDNKFKVEVEIKNYTMEDIINYFNQIKIRGSVN
ncbi:hypothetical protein MKY96_32595 [Paenibacillus sp. FSL R7-0302]|uniref:hypothetical protein n=1 Tax=Paenibacillus sp. FSL R7-0302 TaxID=2921681 RepID=UPI0030F91A71